MYQIKSSNCGVTDRKIYWYIIISLKQANDGPCFVSKPGMFDFQGKKKW